MASHEAWPIMRQPGKLVLVAASLFLAGCAEPPSFEGFMAQGKQAFDKKDWPAAERFYNHAVTAALKAGRTNPKYAESCFQLGNTLENEGKHQDALDYLDKALHAEPNGGMTSRGADILSSMGALYMAAGDSAQAEQCFIKGLQAYQAGIAADGKSKSVADQARSNVSPETGYARRLVQLASLHMAMKKYKNAEKEYKQAVEIMSSATDVRAQEVAATKRELANAMRGTGNDEGGYDMDRRATGTEVQGIKDLIQSVPH